MLKRVCAAIVALSILVVGWVGWERYQRESQNRTIEISVDSDEIRAQVQKDGGGKEEYFAALRAFKQAGATSVAVYEMNLQRMEEQGLVTVYDSKTLAGLGRILPAKQVETLLGGQVKPNYQYVVFDDLNAFRRAKAVFARQFQELRTPQAIEGANVGVFAIPSLYWKDYQKAALWFDEEEVNRVAQMGFSILARPAPRPGITADELKAMFQPLIATGKVKTVVPTGGVIPGAFDARGEVGKAYNPAIEDFITLLKQQSWTLGMIETPQQLGHTGFTGDLSVLQKTDYQAARLYVIQRAELDKPNYLDEQGIIDRWFRAVVDRNIRVLYLRLFNGSETTPAGVLKLNQDIIRESATMLQSKGYTLGTASVLSPLHLSGRMVLVPLGTAAAGVLLLVFWFDLAPVLGYGLLLLALVGAAGVGWLARSPGTIGGRWVTMRQLLGVATHIIYPTLAVMVLLDLLEKVKAGKTLGQAVMNGLRLVVSAWVISLIGGITLGGTLADSTFMLELNYFRGVKMSFLLPMILIAAYFFLRYGLIFKQKPPKRRWAEWRKDIDEILKHPINVAIMIGFAVVAFAGYIYIGRSGNAAGVAVSPLELQLRNFLEHTLVARPRNKEFLIGHPAIMLLPLVLQYGYRWLVGPLLLLGLTGQISIVNSFAHIRTPIRTSVERGFYGLLLGIVIGFVAIVIADAFFKLIKRYWKEPSGWLKR